METLSSQTGEEKCFFVRWTTGYRHVFAVNVLQAELIVKRLHPEVSIVQSFEVEV